MPYKAPGLAPIYTKYDEINLNKAVSKADHELLGERLNIACSTAAAGNYRTQHQRKVARRIYLLVFEEDPNIFIPFILSVSPRACEYFNFSNFKSQHEKRPKILYHESALFLIWMVARGHGIEKTNLFIKWVQWHMQSSPPVTGAEGKENQYWSLRLSSFAAIQSMFGDVIVDAVRRFPPEAEMSVGDYLPESTTNIWTRIPHREPQDSVIRLYVGRAHEVAKVLFPIGSQKVASVLAADVSNASMTALDPDSANTTCSEFADDAYFTLRGAHVEALPSIFSTEVCRGIDESQLRTWEREQLLVDTTDCVTMQLRRGQPHLGIIQLRIGFYAGSHLANVLYQEAPRNSLPSS
ncbi:hypothetical protein N7527_004870 [Penicillium freii]|nr:hypothetical protein N7527_004870 [Penicillium freii]